MEPMPTFVRIAGRSYPVLFVNQKDMGDEVQGMIRYQAQHIKIANMHHADCQKETLFHELLHGASFVANADLKEAQVEAVSQVLFGILRDNKEALRWMMEEEGK